MGWFPILKHKNGVKCSPDGICLNKDELIASLCGLQREGITLMESLTEKVEDFIKLVEKEPNKYVPFHKYPCKIHPKEHILFSLYGIEFKYGNETVDLVCEVSSLPAFRVHFKELDDYSHIYTYSVELFEDCLNKMFNSQVGIYKVDVLNNLIKIHSLMVQSVEDLKMIDSNFEYYSGRLKKVLIKEKKHG